MFVYSAAQIGPSHYGPYTSVGLGTTRVPDLDCPIEEAIHMAQAAIDTTEGHPDQVKHLSSLGLSLKERYIRTGEIADLDLAH
jgi:hypothetical protein